MIVSPNTTRGDFDAPTENQTVELLALATENAELRLQLAEAQEQCIELAVDAGELHSEIEALREELSKIRSQRHRPED